MNLSSHMSEEIASSEHSTSLVQLSRPSTPSFSSAALEREESFPTDPLSSPPSLSFSQDTESSESLVTAAESFDHLSLTESPITKISTTDYYYKNRAVRGRVHRPFHTPDRFLPTRRCDETDRSQLRVGKYPRLLSPSEKRFRRRDAHQDPFISSPRGQNRYFGASPRASNGLNSGAFPRLTPRYLTDPVPSNNAIEGSSPPATSAVWRMEGFASPRSFSPSGVSNGSGGLMSPGAGARMYVADFVEKSTPAENREKYETRVAMALDIDPAARTLLFENQAPRIPSLSIASEQLTAFDWVNLSDFQYKSAHEARRGKKHTPSPFPSTPFRVLDAPQLRDDFYCTTLAYSPTAHALAVGLGSRVYLWSEVNGAHQPPLTAHAASNYVTSLSFSSREGGHSILAVGRHGGQVSLWSTFEKDVRFELNHPNPVSCLAFKQSESLSRRAESSTETIVPSGAEELAVGDELGNIWYYAITWPSKDSFPRNRDKGEATLLAQVSAHSQHICGLSWSPNGRYMASGGNDNVCLLFDLRDILKRPPTPPHQNARPGPGTREPEARAGSRSSSSTQNPLYSNLQRMYTRLSHSIPSSPPSLSGGETRRSPSSLMSNFVRRRFSPSAAVAPEHILIPRNRHKHAFQHAAAVKAISFAPWEPSILATGGGSNDRCIHFYHVSSGACLATINVHAQVTSLIWSRTRREIAATFGYAQPEHPIRIAVFSWPSCQQVVAIPWTPATEGIPADSESNVECGRALWAISYPGGPNEIVRHPVREGTDDGEYETERLSTDSSESSDSIPSIPPDSNAMIRRPSSSRRTPLQPFAGSAQGSPRRRFSPDRPRPRSISQSQRKTKDFREGGRWWSRTAEEGCIVVASSNERVNFHEVWSGKRKSTVGEAGLLAGSKILETVEGIEHEGKEIIR